VGEHGEVEGGRSKEKSREVVAGQLRLSGESLARETKGEEKEMSPLLNA